jgi:hypothetical protein
MKEIEGLSSFNLLLIKTGEDKDIFLYRFTNSFGSLRDEFIEKFSIIIKFQTG